MTDIDTLDEVYMYSRELSPFEVKTLYDNCNFGSAKTRELTCVNTVADPDLQITGGRSSRPWDEARAVLKKYIFRPFGPQFGLEIRGGGVGPPGPLPWIRHLPDVFN